MHETACEGPPMCLCTGPSVSHITLTVFYSDQETNASL